MVLRKLPERVIAEPAVVGAGMLIEIFSLGELFDCDNDSRIAPAVSMRPSIHQILEALDCFPRYGRRPSHKAVLRRCWRWPRRPTQAASILHPPVLLQGGRNNPAGCHGKLNTICRDLISFLSASRPGGRLWGYLRWAEEG